jgi:hypothetical protein
VVGHGKEAFVIQVPFPEGRLIAFSQAKSYPQEMRNPRDGNFPFTPKVNKLPRNSRFHN